MPARPAAALAAVPALALAVTAPAVAESFTISLEEVVSLDMPGPGAGEIAVPGELDSYTFTGVAGTEIYVDELAGGCSIAWSCTGPAGVLFTDGGFCLGDPGSLVLPADGTYEIVVAGEGDATGTYSFTLWAVNPDDVFAITLKNVVSDGAPGPGAGNIEEAGTRDLYTFEGVAGQTLFFDELAGPCGIAWSVLAPDETEIFSDGGFCIGDPGTFVLDQTGTHTIVVDGEGDDTGTYSFTIWEVNRDDFFAIGLEETVSDGVPGVGAGNIEEAGTSDVYELTIDAPTQIFADELSGSCGIRWSLEAPDGTVLFDDGGFCIGDPEIVALDQVGTYTIVVTGEGDDTGTYSFILWELNPDDLGTIGLEETATGTIEEAGTRDILALDVTSPVSIYADELAGPCDIRWSLEAPDGTEVFGDAGFCIGDPEIHVLDQVGTYTIVVDGEGDATGDWSFILWALNPDDVFEVGLGDVVSDGDPGAGAGHIEEPGTRDVYTVALDADLEVCFAELGGSCGIRWSVEGPAGLLFEDNGLCIGHPGAFVIPETGVYTILVDGEGDATGAYSIKLRENTPADFDLDCDVDFADLVVLLAAWGTPNADLNGDGDTGFNDLVILLAAWG